MNLKRCLIYTCLGLCLMGLLASPALAENSTMTGSIAGQLTVKSVEINPQVLMQDDIGIITVTVANTGTESISIRGAELSGKEFTTLNYQMYAATTTIGKGNSMDFTFTIRADPPEGVYYLRFYLDLGTESFRSYIPVRVENTPVKVAVLDRPDEFSSGVKEKITILVGNPRDNALNGVTIAPSGDGFLSTQTAVFIGDLGPGQLREVTFDVSPQREGTLQFTVNYRNGINQHSANVTVPVTFGTNKLAARPMINNIEIASTGTAWTLSADVTNAGLSDACAIIVTTGDPAVPTDPYPVYIVGTLEPDDFASFDLNFRVAPGTEAVPVIVRYKDANGNDFSQTYTVNLRNAATNSTGTGRSGGTLPQGTADGFAQGRTPGLFGGFGSGLGKIPLLEIALAIVAAALLVIAWQKGWAGRVISRFRR